MSKYWEILNQQPDLAKLSYAGTKDMFDLAIESWEDFMLPVYFKDFTEMSTPFVLYKTQADIALKQAITSVLMKEYSQGIYNIRMAIENFLVAIYSYQKPEEVTELINANLDLDKKIRKKSIKFVENECPTFSQKMTDLHKTCDKFGSHQSFSHVGRHVKLGEKDFDVLLVGEDSPELNVGVLGLVAGSMLEFHYVISNMQSVDWIKVNKNHAGRFGYYESKLNALKIKHLPLFMRLL